LPLVEHDPGTKCKWLQTTDYNKYLQTLLDFVSKISSNTVLQFVFNYKAKKLVPISQGIVRIFRTKMFFRDVHTLDEETIDETLEIFRELGAIGEHHLKLLYAMKHNYSSEQDISKLEKTEFYKIWKELKDDEVLSTFTKPFPNTIYWNASKHGGVSKKIRTKEIEFKANEGVKRLSYSDFISTVRELFACALTLTKINLVIRFHKL
jgi:hypothetical protein